MRLCLCAFAAATQAPILDQNVFGSSDPKSIVAAGGGDN